MRLRSFTLESKVALCLAFSIGAAGAQTPVASPSEGPKVGYIRFWNMLPPVNGDFVLQKEGASSSGGALAIRGTAYRYSGYVAFPAGRLRLSVFKDADRNTALKTFDINLPQNTFFTVLVGPKLGGGGSFELIDDTVYPKAQPGNLTIRNCFPGLSVSVSSGAQRITEALAYGQSYTARNMGSTLLPLKLATRLPNGTPAEGGSEVDFKNIRRATVLIIPDSYGRFRPRVIADGTIE